jgi:hypothetical protein
MRRVSQGRQHANKAEKEALESSGFGEYLMPLSDEKWRLRQDTPRYTALARKRLDDEIAAQQALAHTGPAAPAGEDRGVTSPRPPERIVLPDPLLLRSRGEPGAPPSAPRTDFDHEMLQRIWDHTTRGRTGTEPEARTAPSPTAVSTPVSVAAAQWPLPTDAAPTTDRTLREDAAAGAGAAQWRSGTDGPPSRGR